MSPTLWRILQRPVKCSRIILRDAFGSTEVTIYAVDRCCCKSFSSYHAFSMRWGFLLRLIQGSAKVKASPASNNKLSLSRSSCVLSAILLGRVNERHLVLK